MSTKRQSMQSKPKRRLTNTGKIEQVTWQAVLGIAPDQHLSQKNEKKKLETRVLRFEEMEQRLALSADPLTFAFPQTPDINFGSVYFEDDRGMGMDQYGDVFQINWNGGAAGTQLTEIRINLDKNQNGIIDPGECFFDTEGKNGGVYGYGPFAFVSMEGVGSYEFSVEDGGQLLVIRFTDFEAGGKFVFSIDVDEYDVRNGKDNTSAIAEGKEFEGSILTGIFTHPDYDTLEASAVYYDRYDDPANVGLDLPDVGYGTTPPKEVQTAAGIGAFTQTPKKGSLSGYVYEDNNNNGLKETGEAGIKDVQLSLWVWDGSKYVNTGKIATTDKDGYYLFDNLDPNKIYRVTETQPGGYLDGLDTAGSLGGEALNPGDQISDIPLGANQHGVNYNFGELKPGSLSGYVYEDYNNNGIKETGEKGIKGVQLTLWKWDGSKYVNTGKTAETDGYGYYIFENLDPNAEYRITEQQPNGYIDGLDAAGSLGGEATNPGDQISKIPLKAGQHGTDYNFGELKPGSLSGYVYEDDSCDGIKQENEKGIPNIELTLWVWDEEGQKYVNTGITQTTAADGSYKFDNLDPFKKYQITEKQPPADQYFEGKDQVGSLGGIALHPTENTLTEIIVGYDAHGINYNFGERLPASIGGYVYEDKNDNGIKETGEAGIPNVEITLYIWDSTQEKYVSTERTVKTDANGYYNFDHLDPCKLYAVRETQPGDYLDGKDTPGDTGKVGDNDEIKDIDPTPGKEDKNNNFGELKPGSLSGYVFQDGETKHLYANDPDPTVAPPDWTGEYKNGVKPIAGVVLILADAQGNPLKDANGNVIKATTDANGYYEFTMLPEGTYSVLEEQPDGYIDGIDTPGTTGGKAINAYDTSTIAELRAAGILVDSFKNDAIIGIHLGYAEHSKLNNFSEVKVLRDLVPPVDPPVTPPGNPPDLPHFNPGLPQGVTGQFVPVNHISYQPGTNTDRLGPEMGGGGLPEPNYTWHLSVLNGGYPRGENETQSADLQTSALASAAYTNVSWQPVSLNRGKWIVRDKYGKAVERHTFGLEGARPIVGDFNGDGIAEVAVYHDGFWYIDLNGNGVWDEEDLIAQLGTGADQPIVGDWDGDGKADIGIFGREWEGDRNAIEKDPGLPSDLNNHAARGMRPKNVPPSVAEATKGHRSFQHTAKGKVRADLIDHVFEYGGEGDFAFTGDFTGDGIATIGVYKNGSFYIDRDGDGRWDPDIDIFIPEVGRPGEIPIVGDFNGDGISEIGLYANGYWRLDTTGNFRLDTEIRFGEPGDQPVVGDFSGDGYAQLGLYRPYDDASPSLMTKDDLNEFPRPESPRPQYGNLYSTQESVEVKSETVQGGLPDHGSNRAERTMHTPHTSDHANE